MAISHELEPLRKWLAIQFLSDPTPCEICGEPVVVVLFGAVAARIAAEDLDPLATLSACVAAGWTIDLMARVAPGRDGGPLPPGDHRLVAVRRSVLTPPQYAAASAPTVGKRKDVNAAMMATLAGDVTAVWWTARRWSASLGCTPQMVTKTPTWKAILETRRRERRDRREGL